jgi:hypothetical protein
MMRPFALVIVGAAAVGCFGKIAPQPSDGGADDANAADAGVDGDAGPLFPIPHCTATSVCLPGFYGAIQVNCDPEPIKGPWPLVLERQIVNDWRVVQAQKVDQPGFGVTFNDTNAPKVAHLLYRVCVDDDYGDRCTPPLETISAPICGPCVPFTCADFQACNTVTSNGCGGTVTCGDCPTGQTCTPAYQSCCPPKTEPDGWGGCVCAPPHRCPRHYYWDTGVCMCEPLFRPAEPL